MARLCCNGMNSTGLPIGMGSGLRRPSHCQQRDRGPGCPQSGLLPKARCTSSARCRPRVSRVPQSSRLSRAEDKYEDITRTVECMVYFPKRKLLMLLWRTQGLTRMWREEGLCLGGTSGLSRELTSDPKTFFDRLWRLRHYADRSSKYRFLRRCAGSWTR